jgi:biopolymer transport protein TolR
MAEYARRKNHRLMAQINVVPYIDVMLVLLVIFMVTAPLITTTVIDLPSISRSNQPPAVPIEVVVKAKDNLMVRERDKAGSPSEKRVSQDELVKLLRSRQKDKTEIPVVIAADKTVPYGEVIEIMDLLQRNQIRKVGLLAKPAASQ